MLYTIVLVSAIHQHEQATGTHTSPPALQLFLAYGGKSEKNLAGEFSCGNSVSPALNRMKESLTMILNNLMGLPRWLSDKESFCSAGDVGSIPGWARYPREGNGLPLQDSCLENPMDRRAWWATVHGVAESWTQPSD